MTLAKLVLESGKIFTGRIFAAGKESFGEVIFNTGMSGYQEIITDPSYKHQLVVLTYPLVGNYGITARDHQSKSAHLSALLVKEYIDFPSNWECVQSLKSFLESHDVMGVEGIDTRALTLYLRKHGAQKALLTASTEPDEILIERARSIDLILGQNLAKVVCTSEPYEWPAPETVLFKVAVLDCGVKFGILDQLRAHSCQVTVFPYNVPASTLLNGGFDGVLISNGPGAPEPVTEAIETIRALAGKLPLFGICLGHQLLSLAFNMKIMKLPFGHHGLNHPILNRVTGKVEISSQNHIYCTDPTTLHPDFFVSHLNLNDHSVAGIRSDKLLAFSVQHHPEAAPGPLDSTSLFDDFCYLMTHRQFKESGEPAPLKEVLKHA